MKAIILAIRAIKAGIIKLFQAIKNLFVKAPTPKKKK